ncbi:MAG: 1,4-alpha-glucan branching protein GlgB [Pseudomonadales bacterium]|nr:1,4-alpha-glucan branching protein GlgB [Pseudomonadales bacterium]
MEKPAETTLSITEADALVSGRHENVFAVLGLHDHPAGKGLLIRAFLPRAGSVSVIDRKSGRNLGTMQRVRPEGLFELHMPRRKNRFAYFFRVDSTQYLEDPYRFSSTLNEDELYLFNEGTAEHCWRWLGAHKWTIEKVEGVRFCVWAPAARRVSVVGDFNGWDGRQHVMRKHPASGIWEIFIPSVAEGALYKFEISGPDGELLDLRSDPYALSMQHPPETASRVVYERAFDWSDGDWMLQRSGSQTLNSPVSIYEVHLGSWRRRQQEGNRYLSYSELAAELIPYVQELGFTHLQLMPVSEYPFDGSWGYQPVGMFAPTIRYGTPDEFRAFVDECHRHNIGVLIDWVPGHFPTDPHGLGKFDGTCLYEHMDVRRGFHPDWNTLIYNYGRGEVLSFLLSNANYWLEEFHLDGIRVDAVASMLYLDYSRKEGEWLPNEHGGRENLEAIAMLQLINSKVYRNHPGIMMIAEESTAWPGVSRPVDQGGLGFGYKWNMGWMNDSVEYMKRDPVHRSYHHNEMTFSTVYAWDENFVLSLSHDEVVHGKGSLLEKMPGDDWQKFANLRAYFGFMWGHPGKKLIFMGAEFAQRREWNHDRELDWDLLESAQHQGMQLWIRDLNRLYRELPALHQLDHAPAGFEWLQVDGHQDSIFAWARKGNEDDALVVVVVNMTPQTHHGYRLGVPAAGWYQERLNSDATCYGGSGVGNLGQVLATEDPADHQPCSLEMSVPPLATVFFEFRGG